VSPLEADIQLAWERASSALKCVETDRDEIAALICLLDGCRQRSELLNLAFCSRELARMAAHLEGRISDAAFPIYKCA
jgi:hypothetical protein